MSNETKAIINVGIKYMKVETANSYLQKIIEIIKAQIAVTGVVDITELSALIDKLHTAMVAKKGFLQTERLQLSDNFRDNILSAINHYLKAESLMPTEDQQDAKALLHSLQEFGVTNIRRAKLRDETALIRSLITRLNSGDNVARMVKFPKLEDWTTILEEANNDFESIMNEKTDDVEQGLDFVSATKTRDQITPVYESVIAKINAHALIGTAPEFAAVVSAINAVITSDNLN